MKGHIYPMPLSELEIGPASLSTILPSDVYISNRVVWCCTSNMRPARVLERHVDEHALVSDMAVRTGFYVTTKWSGEAPVMRFIPHGTGEDLERWRQRCVLYQCSCWWRRLWTGNSHRVTKQIQRQGSRMRWVPFSEYGSSFSLKRRKRLPKKWLQKLILSKRPHDTRCLLFVTLEIGYWSRENLLEAMRTGRRALHRYAKAAFADGRHRFHALKDLVAKGVDLPRRSLRLGMLLLRAPNRPGLTPLRGWVFRANAQK